MTYYEKSAQLNQSPLAFLFVSLVLIALLATFYFLFMKQDLLTAHYTYMGQILLSQAFSFIIILQDVRYWLVFQTKHYVNDIWHLRPLLCYS